MPHPTVALCVAGEGHNDVMTEGRWRRLPFRPGVMAMQGQGVESSRMVWTGSAREILALQMPPDGLQLLVHEARAVPALPVLGPFEDDTLAQMLLMMRRECELGCPSGRLFAQGLSLALLGHLGSRYGSGAASGTCRGTLSSRDLSRLDAYIADHVADDLGVDQLAAQLRLSPAHFARLFKRSTGLTPYRYVLRQRIDRAVVLLRGNDPLAEVAQQVGFAHQSHFTQVFRQHLGTTPAAVRAALRGTRGQ